MEKKSHHWFFVPRVWHWWPLSFMSRHHCLQTVWDCFNLFVWKMWNYLSSFRQFCQNRVLHFNICTVMLVALTLCEGSLIILQTSTQSKARQDLRVNMLHKRFCSSLFEWLRLSGLKLLVGVKVVLTTFNTTYSSRSISLAGALTSLITAPDDWIFNPG